MAENIPFRAQLFNNPLLSDVKILQTSNKVTKEYYAHKTTLMNHSEWFFKAFTGPFKEATATKVEVHDDNADHFEIMIKFVYGAPWEKSLAKSDGFELRKNIMGVHILADKYGCAMLNDALSKVYPPMTTLPVAQLKLLIETHYGSCFGEQCGVGESLVLEMLRCSPKFMKEKGIVLVQKHPRFGRDIVLVISRETGGDAHQWEPTKWSTRW